MDSQGKNPGQMGSQRGSDRPESSSSRSQDIRLVQGAPPSAAAVPKMACDRLFSPDPTNLKPISNSNLSPPFLFGPEVEGIRLNYWGAGRQSMKGRWRPGFGVVSLPEAEGKAVAAPAPDIPVRPSSPSPSPQTTRGGAGRAGGDGGACRSRARASNASPAAP